MIHLNKIVLILFVLLNGCASTPEKIEAQERSIDAKIIVSTEVNPDINQRASPIVVRLYELKTLGAYQKSDFYNLFENYKSALGMDLLASEQFSLQPGDTQLIQHTISPDTQYIAVIAAYRDINQAMWRDSLIISKDKFTQLFIFVDKLNISIWKK